MERFIKGDVVVVKSQGMIDIIIGVHFATLFSILEIIEKGEVAEAWGLRLRKYGG